MVALDEQIAAKVSDGAGAAIPLAGIDLVSGVDASTAGRDRAKEEQKNCSLKLRRLSTMTLSYLGEKSEYVPTFCKVAELHPRDPKNPQPGSACKK